MDVSISSIASSFVFSPAGNRPGPSFPPSFRSSRRKRVPFRELSFVFYRERTNSNDGATNSPSPAVLCAHRGNTPVSSQFSLQLHATEGGSRSLLFPSIGKIKRESVGPKVETVCKSRIAERREEGKLGGKARITTRRSVAA